ncbi:hypothetical protein EIN_034110 [Entamoeba invadens IP1]|uniref:Uncharacterized protein n=1 Tax=Entamoeba invadens IP1 TaxID=370355 RepID=A0A0A1TYD7_ENTIV|nr:hypothetical protein EIN_034110 [Entamoeba invadens IP1]ELP86500.1 hypothetical protein EIN_034110 [Entamoeba invadens IP1]|eukprot:XP_004185846.1 hypothetical protein EIN_034110 [Entamoeba invadens IP1]
MQTPSAFHPLTARDYSYFTIIPEISDELNSLSEKGIKTGLHPQDSEKTDKSSKKADRNWSLNATKFIMLKYRHWQLAHRRVISFVDFLKTSSDEIQRYFHVKKSASQIKDKINNTKTGYVSLAESVKPGKEGKKHALSSKKIPNDVFCFMDKFYNAQRSVFVENVIAEIGVILSEEAQKENTA